MYHYSVKKWCCSAQNWTTRCRRSLGLQVISGNSVSSHRGFAWDVHRAMGAKSTMTCHIEHYSIIMFSYYTWLYMYIYIYTHTSLCIISRHSWTFYLWSSQNLVHHSLPWFQLFSIQIARNSANLPCLRHTQSCLLKLQCFTDTIHDLSLINMDKSTSLLWNCGTSSSFMVVSFGSLLLLCVRWQSGDLTADRMKCGRVGPWHRPGIDGELPMAHGDKDEPIKLPP